jgi:hypothetical protein
MWTVDSVFIDAQRQHPIVSHRVEMAVFSLLLDISKNAVP